MEQQTEWDRLVALARERFGPEMVFGEGPRDAALAIVGEAPGEHETAEHRPFVGRAGQLLNQLLATAGLDRSQIYLTNTVKLRPTVVEGGRIRNRPPRVAELRAGLEILLPELTLLAPRLLLLFGNVPAKALIDKQFTMRAGRGRWWRTSLGIPALPSYHPAYLLRLEGDDYTHARDLVLADLAAVRAGLTAPPRAEEFATASASANPPA